MKTLTEPNTDRPSGARDGAITPQLFHTENSLTRATRAEVAEILNQTLADMSDLHSQTKQAHWNVRGPLFYSLHKLFNELAASVEAHLGDIAERITALGALAQGTVRQAAAHSRLEEFPTEQASDTSFLAALTERFALCANEARQAVDDSAHLGDADTADLLTPVSRDLDKGLWMLEAHTRPVSR